MCLCYSQLSVVFEPEVVFPAERGKAESNPPSKPYCWISLQSASVETQPEAWLDNDPDFYKNSGILNRSLRAVYFRPSESGYW